MSRIDIAMSGSPNPAEIIDLVVLAESLGYASAWVAEGMAATSAPSWGQGHAVFSCHTEKLQSECWLGGEGVGDACKTTRAKPPAFFDPTG